MKAASEANVTMATNLSSDASQFLDEAKSAFSLLRDRESDMESTIADLDATMAANQEGIRENYDRANEAANHAEDLTRQADEFERLFRTTIDSDLERKVEAATSHGNIVEAVNAAEESANKALEAAEEARAMVSRSSCFSRK